MTEKPRRSRVSSGPPARRARLAAGFLAGALSACSDLSSFQLSEGEAYCGSMVSAPLFHAGFVAEGSPPSLRLRLHLDVDQLTTTPGRLTSDDANRGLCKDNGGALFDEARLRAIPPVLHDPISALEFGEGREHSFFAYVDSTCQGTMLGVISLMKSGEVEVRLFKPRPEAPAGSPASEQSGYALFYLKPRDADNCGF